MSILSSNVSVRHCPIFSRESNSASPTSSNRNSPNRRVGGTGSGLNRVGKVIGGWTSSHFPPPNPSPLYSPPLTSLTLPSAAVFQTEKLPPLQLQTIHSQKHQQLQDDGDSDLISPQIASPATTERTSGDWDLTSLSSPLRFLRRSSNSSSFSSLSYSDNSREDSINTPRTPVAQSTDRSESPDTPRYDQLTDASATHNPRCDREDIFDDNENCKGALSPLGPRFLATPEQFRCLVDGLDDFHLPPATHMLSLPASTLPDEKFDSDLACNEIPDLSHHNSVLRTRSTRLEGNKRRIVSQMESFPSDADRHCQFTLDDLAGQLHHTYLDSSVPCPTLHRAASDQLHYRSHDRQQPQPRLEYDAATFGCRDCGRHDRQLSRRHSLDGKPAPQRADLRRARSSSDAALPPRDVVYPSPLTVGQSAGAEHPHPSLDTPNRVTWFHINCRHRPAYS